MKTSTKLAWSYINSEFFRISLMVSKTFKVVSDVTRLNEDGDQEAKWNAGPNFIKKFRQKTSEFAGADKIQSMIFCGDENKAKEKFSKIGFSE